MTKLYSIYVMSDTTSICEISKSRKNINLYQTFRIDTPKGCVEDGIVIDAAELAKAIRQVLPEKGYQKHKVVFTVSSRRIANKEIVLPYVKNKKTISEIITANVHDYFPMSNIKDYVYEYTVLEVFEEEDRKQYRLSAAAVQKELVESYQELAKELKLAIESIDYYGNSMFQIMKQQVEEGSNTLVLQMEKDMTHVSIMEGKAQVFRRTIPFGERTIIQAVAELKQISESEAKKMIRQEGRKANILSGKEYKEVARDVVSSIIRVVDFHVSRNPGMIIETAKLFGEGGNIDGLAELMERELNIPVKVPKYLEGIAIKGADVLMGIDITAYLPNLGAVLKPLNLQIDEEEKKGTDSSRIYAIILGGAALISIALVSITLLGFFSIKGEKESLEADIAKISDIEQIFMEYESAVANLEMIENYYRSTENRNESLYEFIVTLEKTMPESVGIISLDAKEGDINLSGIASGKDLVADFVIELKKISFVSDIWVKDITDTYDEMGNPTSLFNMTFKLQQIDEESIEEAG